MPKRTDLRKIMIIGSGPIVIGQACEFDYSGTQGCRALREEGYEVVLVNSNPATIMTDPEMASRTYVEPLTPEFVARIIQRERPQALLPTLGREAVRWGLQQSPAGTVLIEESVIGWKEFELEVMRDLADNVVIICSIENVDPMGVHTGDSVTVAPAQTLTDKEYQLLRDAAVAIIREIGVETGGSNIQFAVNPDDGRLVVIEMNPRVSRSSALASKATGFPIAKIAAKLAVGYRLDEVRNDITRETPASFEPAIDYCVVKFPRWAFEKFPEADRTLTTQMKSVGEVMAIGRTFKEALQKSIRSLEQDRFGLSLDRPLADDDLMALLRVPNPDRLFAIGDAFRRGTSTAEIQALTRIDPWFLENMREIVEFEPEIRRAALTDAAVLRRAKQLGFADTWIARLTGTREGEIRARRLSQGIRATFKTVDTCAAEFVAHTPYLYSTYEEEDEAPPTDRRKVIILGSGPNRIGQGIEFDYCCVHAAFALRERGVEAIMINCNPETVSTDYDTSDRLYFEPLTLEDVLNVVEKERPFGVLVQFVGEAVEAAPDHPILIDKFLEDSLEIDVDAVADGARVVVGGVMEHIEKAGVHSGDAACALPPYSLDEGQVKSLRAQAKALAKALGVVGLINVQFAIRNETIFVLEVNPRASRTVPFVSKAIGLPLAKVATWALLGEPVDQLAPIEERELRHIAVKESVFPFVKFPGVDIVLGPEMKSTGEVMGLDRDFRKAYLKAQIAAGSPLPTSGKVFVSVKNRDKRAITTLARRLVEMGFSLVATIGTARVLERHGMSVELVYKVLEGHRPNVVDLMKRGDIALVLNTPEDGRARKDSAAIRRAAVSLNVPYYLTIDGAQAAIGAIEALLKGEHQVLSLQEYHADA